MPGRGCCALGEERARYRSEKFRRLRRARKLASVLSLAEKAPPDRPRRGARTIPQKVSRQWSLREGVEVEGFFAGQSEQTEALFQKPLTETQRATSPGLQVKTLAPCFAGRYKPTTECRDIIGCRRFPGA